MHVDGIAVSNRQYHILLQLVLHAAAMQDAIVLLFCLFMLSVGTVCRTTV